MQSGICVWCKPISALPRKGLLIRALDARPYAEEPRPRGSRLRSLLRAICLQQSVGLGDETGKPALLEGVAGAIGFIATVETGETQTIVDALLA